MTGERFDALTQHLASLTTRRQVAKGLGAALLAALVRSASVRADDGPRLVILAPPSTGPRIKAVAVEEITATSATIAWATDAAADSTVEYGPTDDLGQAASDSALVTEHRVALTGLTPETEYHYRIRSRNADGIHATRADRTFTTATDVLAVSPEDITTLALDALTTGDFDAFARTFAPGSEPASWSDFWLNGDYVHQVGNLTSCAGVSYGIGSWSGGGCRPSVHSTDVQVIVYFDERCGRVGDNEIGSLVIATHRIGNGWYLVGLSSVNSNGPEFGEPCVDQGDPSSGGICSPNRVNCHDVCVDITREVDHCGGCDIPCHSYPGAQDAIGCQCAPTTAGVAACIHIVMGGCSSNQGCNVDGDCDDGEICATFTGCGNGICVRLCDSVATDEALPAQYLGFFSGEGTQTNPPESWPITMAFYGGVLGDNIGSDNYPSLGCAASLTLEHVANDGSIELTEQITDGLGVCVDGGTFVLTPQGNDEFSFTWASPDGGSTAEGILTRGSG